MIPSHHFVFYANKHCSYLFLPYIQDVPVKDLTDVVNNQLCLAVGVKCMPSSSVRRDLTQPFPCIFTFSL